ncbi:hypothetical protein [Streptomyces bobili]
MALFPGRVQINEQDLVDQQRERIQLTEAGVLAVLFVLLDVV